MDDLQRFIQTHEPQCEEIVVWGGGQTPLRVVAYRCQTLPPLSLVTSVRGIVLRGDAVLVLRNRDETHLVPGGRCEEGETLTDTLRREILEETGWFTDEYRLLGCLHFHHLAPKPPDFPYLYPDFLHLIYTAMARYHQPAAQLADDYELSAEFMPIAEVLHWDTIALSQRKFLTLALT